MRLATYCVLAIIAFSILWRFRARIISGILDRVYTVVIERPPLDHFRYDNGVLELGRLRLHLMSPDFEWSCTVSIDQNGRVTLQSGTSSFVFGPGRSIPNRSGLPDYPFAPDPGDSVVLTVERSALSWPTPFEMNFMTGVVPHWKRNLYCHLRWTKQSGAKLDMLWHQEQAYYVQSGWYPEIIEAVTSGLVRTHIS